MRVTKGTPSHQVTSVHAGNTVVHRVDLVPTWTLKDVPQGATLRYTPPVSAVAAAAVYVLYTDSTQVRYSDNTAVEYA